MIQLRWLKYRQDNYHDGIVIGKDNREQTKLQYRYRLPGQPWSEWVDVPEVYEKNLRFGQYDREEEN